MSLINSFVMREHLTGNNQYRCEKCNNEYRDADKYCQLRTLPPILTFSLLRFTYDLNTFQRIKEVGKFEFPLELDLADYMEVYSPIKHNFFGFSFMTSIDLSSSLFFQGLMQAKALS
jgi:ubiquitin C-terminal hydrolase